MLRICLTQGKVTFIDDKHADLAALRWYAQKGRKTFYAVRSIPGISGTQTTVLLHQLIADRMGIVGPPDHIDRDGLNNRESNLRQASDGQQAANQGLRTDNTSGYKGVYWRSDRAKWRAQIQVDGKRRHLGYFSDENMAAKAYDLAVLETWGPFAVLNFPRSL